MQTSTDRATRIGTIIGTLITVLIIADVCVSLASAMLNL